MNDLLLIVVVIAAAMGGLVFVARLLQKRSLRSGTAGTVAPVQGAVPWGDQAQYAMLGERLRIEQQVKAGATWFSWIAGLSLLNSALAALGVGGRFFFGLGLTQVTDALGIVLAEELGPAFSITFKVVAFIVAVVVAAVFVLFGVFAKRHRRWAFVAGIALYALDALIFLWAGDYLSMVLHAFALLGLLRGLKALGELSALGELAAGGS